MSLLYSIISCLAVSINYDTIKELYSLNTKYIYNTNSVLVLALVLLIYIIMKKNKDFKINKIYKFISYLLTIFLIIGDTYKTSGSFFIIWDNIGTVILTIIKLIGYSKLIQLLLFIINNYFINYRDRELKVKNKYLKKYIELFNKYPFKTSLITLLIGWSIYLIAFYPIVLSPDPANQIIQYLNVPNKYISWVVQRDPNVFMTTHHPVFHTYLLGFSLSIGRFILNDNFGLFIYTIIQTLVLSSTLAYTIKFAKNNKVSDKLRLILLFIYILVPMFPFYSISANKDTLYTAFMILYVLFIYNYIKTKDISIKSVILFTLTMLLLCLLRNNGIYVITLTTICLFIFLKNNRIKIISSYLLVFISLFMFNNVLVPHLGISNGSIREMLSVPIQQTARLVKYEKSSITKEDKKVINKVLDYDNMASDYNPELADPVKNKFKPDATNEEVKNYLIVWFKGLLKHPLIYIDATLNNTYGFISPNKHKWYIYANYNDTVTKDNLVDYHYNSLDTLRNILIGYGTIFPYIPLIGLISNIGFNTWVMIILTGYLLSKKKYKYIMCFIPLYASFIFCIIGPANTYFRYAMPYIFVLPILTILLLKEGSKNEKK